MLQPAQYRPIQEQIGHEAVGSIELIATLKNSFLILPGPRQRRMVTGKLQKLKSHPKYSAYTAKVKCHRSMGRSSL